MKTLIKIAVILFCAIPLGLQAQSISNGNVRTGTFAGWRAYTGMNSGGMLNLSTFTEGIVMDRHRITTPANDPIVGAPINQIFPIMEIPNDTFSIKVGNSSGGRQAEIVSYKIPSYQLHHRLWGFSFAFIGSDLHSSGDIRQNPFLNVWVSTSDELVTSVDSGNLLGDTTIYLDSSFYFRTLGTSITRYREWTRVELQDFFPALADYTGDDLTIYFATADCSAGGHYGYAYIDNVYGKSKTIANFTMSSVIPAAPAAPIYINGAASVAESRFSFEIIKVNAAGVPLPGAITYSTETAVSYTGFIGSMNLRPVFDLVVPSGYFTPGRYRLTLRTWNSGAASESSTSRVFKIE